MWRRHPFTTDRCKAYIMEYENPPPVGACKHVVTLPIPLTPKLEKQLALPVAKRATSKAIVVNGTTAASFRHKTTAASVRHKTKAATVVHKTAAATSCATKVFNIAELVEQIFQYYEASDIYRYEDVATMSVMLKLQLINRTMRGVVMHSPYFSRLLFLKETPGHQKPWFVQAWNNTINPIISHAPSKLRDCFGPLVQVSWGMTPQQFRLQLSYHYTLEKGRTSTEQNFKEIGQVLAKHQGGTWRWMKLHYMEEMGVVVTIKVYCKLRGYEDGVVLKGMHQILLPKDADMGTVVDQARELITWIESVATEGHDLENLGEDWTRASAEVN